MSVRTNMANSSGALTLNPAMSSYHRRGVGVRLTPEGSATIVCAAVLIVGLPLACLTVVNRSRTSRVRSRRVDVASSDVGR